MAGKSSITPEQGLALLEAMKEGLSERQAAKATGVSRSAAQRYLASIGPELAPIVSQSARIVEQAGASLFDTRTVLEENYQRVLKLISQLDAGIIEVKGEWQTHTPVTTMIAALREVREHAKDSLDALRLLISIDQTAAFQQTVIEAIREADPATAKLIIDKLKERRALGLLTQRA